MRRVKSSGFLDDSDFFLQYTSTSSPSSSSSSAQQQQQLQQQQQAAPSSPMFSAQQTPMTPAGTTPSFLRASHSTLHLSSASFGTSGSPRGSAAPQLQLPVSQNANSSRDLLTMYRTVLKEVHRLRKEVEYLRKEVHGIEKESSTWTLRYSRRILSLSNLVLAIYLLAMLMPFSFSWVQQRPRLAALFNKLASALGVPVPLVRPAAAAATAAASVAVQSLESASTAQKLASHVFPAGSTRARIARFVQEKSGDAFQSKWARSLFDRYVVPTTNAAMSSPPIQTNLVDVNLRQTREPSGSVLLKGGKGALIRVLWKTVVKSALLVFSSYYLHKKTLWKRNVGLVISIMFNVYMAFSGEISTWAVYFNAFLLLLYLTARTYQIVPDLLPSQKDQQQQQQQQQQENVK